MKNLVILLLLLVGCEAKKPEEKVEYPYGVKGFVVQLPESRFVYIFEVEGHRYMMDTQKSILHMESCQCKGTNYLFYLENKHIIFPLLKP